MKRHFVLALLVLAGCTPGDSAADPLPKPGRALKREVCPGNHCWGIHSFQPPSTCDRCGAGGQATAHHLCKTCAEVQGRCPHCAGKLPEPKSETPPVVKKETPPPREPEPPPPPVPREPPAPKAPVDFKLEDVKGETLRTETADPPMGQIKMEHPLFVFACLESEYINMCEKHANGKTPEVPLKRQPTDDLVLYVLWGDRLGDPAPSAIIDRKNRRVVVTARWTGHGLMDTGTIYRGYGFKLGPLEAGHYQVWVREATPVDKDGPKLTKEISFEVKARP